MRLAYRTRHRPATPVEGRFRECFEPFDENSKNTRVSLGLALPKLGLTRFLTDNLKIYYRKEITYDRK